MNKIKRIRVQESLNLWNDKHPVQIKKTALTVSEKIDVRNVNLSLWNSGNVAKSIQALHSISVLLKVKFDDLFEIEYNKETDTTTLKRIALKEAIEQYAQTHRKRNFNTLGELIPYSNLRLRKWNKGELPFSIINFFNFCKEVEIRPSKALEF